MLRLESLDKAAHHAQGRETLVPGKHAVPAPYAGNKPAAGAAVQNGHDSAVGVLLLSAAALYNLSGRGSAASNNEKGVGALAISHPIREGVAGFGVGVVYPAVDGRSSAQFRSEGLALQAEFVQAPFYLPG